MAVDLNQVKDVFGNNKIVVGVDSSGEPVYILLDENGLICAKLYGIYDPAGAAQLTAVQVGIDGKLEASTAITAHVDDLEDLTQELIDLSKYAFRNVASAGDPIYVGYEASDGAWRIMEYTKATGVALYATGSSGYAAAWTGRAGLGYS